MARESLAPTDFRYYAGSGTKPDGSRKYYVARGANRARMVRTYLKVRAELEERGEARTTKRWSFWHGSPDWAKPTMLPKVAKVAEQRPAEFRLLRERERRGDDWSPESLAAARENRRAEKLGYRGVKREPEWPVPHETRVGEVSGLVVAIDFWPGPALSLTVNWLVDGECAAWHVEGSAAARVLDQFRPYRGRLAREEFLDRLRCSARGDPAMTG